MPKVKIKKVPFQGLMVEDNNLQPISSQTQIITGDSHTNGGEMLQYGGNLVEAEAGEPISVNSNGDLTIFGAMKIPQTNTTFKSAVKQIGQEEAKADRLSTKANNLVATNDPYNKYENLSYQSGIVLEDAANIKRNQAQNFKDKLGNLQDLMLNVSNQLNIDPKNLEKALNGKKVPQIKETKNKARNGKTLAERNNNPGNIKYDGQPGAVRGDKGFAKFNSYEEGFQALVNDLKAKQSGNTRTGLTPMSSVRNLIDIYAPASDNNNPEQYSNTISQRMGVTPSTPIGTIPTERLAREIARFEDSAYAEKMGAGQVDNTPIADNPSLQPIVSIPNFLPLNPSINDLGPTNYNPNFDPRVTSPMGGQPLLDEEGFRRLPTQGQVSALNDTTTQRTAPLPLTRNTLSPLDFLGEAAAIFDRPDYVPLQQYNPQLLTPYRITTQEQRNQNTSTFNALRNQVGNNPEALSTLAGQRYAADQQSLADEFRINQQISNQITNQNNQIQNQAQLTNLQLADTQYQRQEAARALTDQNRQNALNSISAKVAQNRLLNNQLAQTDQRTRTMENLFDYRQNNQGQLQYIGPDAVFYQNGVPIQPLTPEQIRLRTQQAKTEEQQAKTQREKNRSMSSMFNNR